MAETRHALAIHPVDVRPGGIAAACPAIVRYFNVLILPGANIFSRVGFKLTYLAGFRFSLDVIHMAANYLVSVSIEDHQAFAPLKSGSRTGCNCDVT